MTIKKSTAKGSRGSGAATASPPRVQPPALRGGHPRARSATGSGPQPRRVLCVVPRLLRFNPIARLLPGYDLAMADTTAQVLRISRRQAHDLYVIVTPLGWIDSVEACRRIRRFDPNTPLVVYSSDFSSSEKRELMAAGAQACIARADDVQNLSGIAGQLIMLAELRSMEATSAAGEAMRAMLLKCLARLRKPRGRAVVVRAGSEARLKAEARRLFALAGGSRANFERLWPSLYESALEESARPTN